MSDVWGALSALLEGGVNGYRLADQMRGVSEDRAERKRMDDDTIRARKEQEAERTSLRLEGARRDMENRRERRERDTRSGKVARSALSTTERGRNILLSGLGELDDEALGQENVLRNFDDIMRAIADPKPAEPKPWQPMSMDDELKLYEGKKKLDRRYDPPRAGRGEGAGGGNAERAIALLNPLIDDADREVKRFDPVLKSNAETNQIRLMNEEPPIPIAAADTAGLGDARATLRRLTDARTGAMGAFMTGEDFDARPYFTPGATNQPSAGSAPAPHQPTWNIPGMLTDSREALRKQYQDLIDALMKNGYNPDQARAAADHRFKTIRDTRVASGVR